jgi:hypothetical protein
MTHTVLVVTFDWDFGEFFEIMDDWPGFSDVTNAIAARFPEITPDWLETAQALSPCDPGLNVWNRQ